MSMRNLVGGMGSNPHIWVSEVDERSVAWNIRFRIGRVLFWLSLLRHRHPTLSDRWVSTTQVTYDRK